MIGFAMLAWLYFEKWLTKLVGSGMVEVVLVIEGQAASWSSTSKFYKTTTKIKTKWSLEKIEEYFKREILRIHPQIEASEIYPIRGLSNGSGLFYDVTAGIWPCEETRQVKFSMMLN